MLDYQQEQRILPETDKSPFRLATVKTISGYSARLLFDGDDAESTKTYRFGATLNLQTGERVVCAKVYGTYVIVAKMAGTGISGGGTGGGYYVPYVDAAGNLTWSPSKSGMPAVSVVNIRGPGGDAGDTPYIGTNGNWWIGEEDTGVTAKGTVFQPGNAIELNSGVLNVITTDEMSKDNTLPITAAGLYKVIGDVKTILESI